MKLTSGTATIWTPDGVETPMNIYTDRQAFTPLGTCDLLGLERAMFGEDSVEWDGLHLYCNVTGEEMDTLHFYDQVADPRTLEADTTSLAMWGDCWDWEAENLLAVVTLTQATGGIAPYPRMVTPDYRRSYTVTLDTGPIDCSSGAVPAGCSVCQQIARMRVEFSLEQDASSFSYTEHGPCDCK